MISSPIPHEEIEMEPLHISLETRLDGETQPPHHQLSQCKKMTKAFRRKNAHDTSEHTQRAGDRGVSTKQMQMQLEHKTIGTAFKMEDFGGGPSRCIRLMRANNPTVSP